MVERDGIYVGNREITERYVGDKLVWSKFRYINSINNWRVISNYQSTSWTATFGGSGKFRDIYNKIVNKAIKKVMIKIRRNSTFYTFYAMNVSVYDSNSGSQNYNNQEYGLILTFADESIRNKFSSFFKASDTLDIYVQFR